MADRKGPLSTLKIIELGGIGPVPFCSMLLADLGAEVVRIDRLSAHDGGAPVDPAFNLLNRSRRSVALDLKNPAAVSAVLRLVGQADAVLEGFRPGVAERLGLGPEECFAVNSRIVYGRMTGWGQDGPLSHEPGHDLNYISIAGALHAIGRSGEPPAIPLNLVGDFGGGSLYLAFGVVAAILERSQSGKGQVVDAAMVDGVASLMTLVHGLLSAGYWTDHRGVNRLDSGAPWYNVYQAGDGKYLSIAANETRFFNNAVKLLGLADSGLADQHDTSGWPLMREEFAAAFKTRPRDEWIKLAEGREVCLTPVLSLREAPFHPHLVERQTFVEVEGLLQPAPAPRFGRTPGAIQSPPPKPGEHTNEILMGWGFSAEEIKVLRDGGAIA